MDAGASLPDLVFAGSEVSNHWSDGGLQPEKDVGFDLDNTCTGEGQRNSCVEPPWATADHTDGIGGVDNAWGTTDAGTYQLLSNSPRLILRVRSYSGGPDDDQVEVCLYVGLGVAPREGESDGGSTPLWDGNDRFYIMPELLAPSASPSIDEPLYCDVQAYVTGGMLVAHFRQALWSPSNPYAPYEFVRANQVVLDGRLTRVGGQWALQDAVVDMRVPVRDFLAAFVNVPNPATGITWCQDARSYAAARQFLCSLVDIAFIQGPPSAPCDALSSAALFQAKQAQLGEVLPPPPPAPSCPPLMDPTTDPCEPLGD